MKRPVVEVAAFRALEYNPEKVALADVVSPPYDVIPDPLLKTLRKSSPYNLVHVTLHQRTAAQPRKKVDPFAEADRILEQWIANGVLRTTSADQILAYECLYDHRATPRRMRGVILLLRLDPTYTAVLPHEEIFSKPSDERAKLLRATATDLEPIQLLYSGKSAEEAMWAYVDGSHRAPDLLATGPDGVVHKYWRINDAAVIGTVVEGFKGRKVYIADGHHRYSAAVKYAEERRTREYRPPKNAPWEYKVSLVVNASDPGLLILPTHRVVARVKAKSSAKILELLQSQFTVRPVALGEGNPVSRLVDAVDTAVGEHVLGAWLGETGKGFLLNANELVLPETKMPGKSHTYRTLDVVYLQHVAIGDALDIPPAKWGDVVHYTRDDAEAFALLKRKKGVLVLTHKPTRLVQLRAIADSGEKMPQKSTYFWPKTLSGVAMHRIGKPGPVTKPRITS